MKTNKLNDIASVCEQTGRPCPFVGLAQNLNPREITTSMFAVRLESSLRINRDVPLKYLIGEGTESSNRSALKTWVKCKLAESIPRTNSESEKFDQLRSELRAILAEYYGDH
ncbi:MAG: hypothetical protein JAZ19_09790 [Candidatus Thiodiazotropha taylori]|nr:hypothetical protein [Candidatus Thiodiazotropha taylori]